MSLKDKINQIKEKEKEESKIDWEARKNWWILEVNRLHGLIESWLKEYVEAKDVRLETSSKSLTEETLGRYNVNSMYVRVGNTISLLLEPIGSVIIGGYGRIDFFKEGKRAKKFMLILTKKEETEEYRWAIADAQNKRDFKLLNQERFEEAMENLIDG